jgi:hypothetical protein
LPRDSLIFVKSLNKNYLVVVSLDENEDGKIILYLGLKIKYRILILKGYGLKYRLGSAYPQSVLIQKDHPAEAFPFVPIIHYRPMPPKSQALIHP